MIEEVRFAKVHIFPYSSRPKVRSSRFPDPIPVQEIHRRKHILLAKANQVAFDLRNDFIGKELEVLIESNDSARGNGYMRGHTDNFLEISVQPSPLLLRNTIVRVKTFANEADSLLARVI
mgnify:FL=1